MSLSRGFALLCPGQGSQHAEMFGMFGDSEHGDHLLRNALEPLLSRPLPEVLSDKKSLYENRFAQPLIVASQLIAWKSLSDSVPRPELVAGYSVGELAAYGVAGSLSAQDCIAIAPVRAMQMDSAAAGAPQGLLAVTGIAASRTKEIMAFHSLFAAIEIDHDAILAGGPAAALAAARMQLESAGAVLTELPVGVASHTPLMHAATAPFAALLENVYFTAPDIPVIAGISGALISDASAGKAMLVRQLVETIKWSNCMDVIQERGITVALELGPGAALSHMLRKRHPGIACRSISEFRSRAAVLRWLDSQGDR